MPERMLLDESPRLINASLLPHEFVHAWNGKYRRPAGLIRAPAGESEMTVAYDDWRVLASGESAPFAVTITTLVAP